MGLVKFIWCRNIDKYSLIDVYIFTVVFPQALVAEIEQNQIKLDECQTHSKQYCTSVKVNTSWNLTKTVEYFNDWYFFNATCVPLWLHFVGLWTAADDLQSLCRIYPQVPCQEKEDALFLWRHHSGGKDTWSAVTFSVDVLPWIEFELSAFNSTVYGLAHTLHSLGNLNDTACKVHQRCTEKARRRGGGALV